MTKFIITIILISFLSVDLRAQSWSEVTTENTCTERHECASAAVGKKLYLLGGRGMKPVEEYDPQTNQWKKLAMAPLEMHHFQAVTYENKIYVLGAFTGGYPHETPIPHVYIFDPASNQWEKGHEIPEDRRRGAAGLVVYQDKFYLVGGIEDGHWADNRDYMDEYDPRTGEWKILPDLPRVRDHFQSVVVENKLYAVGGRKSHAKEGHNFELTYGEVDVFDFASQQWETLDDSQQLPTQRAGSSTIEFDNGFIVIGGESSSQVQAHDEVEFFRPGEGWGLLNRLDRGRHGFQVVKINDNYYVAAGCGNRGGNPELNSLEVMK